MPDTPIMAYVSSKGHVTYVYRGGRVLTLHGTHPYRDNNPGNLRYLGKHALARAKRAGAIGLDHSFAIFATADAGRDALNRLITRRGNEGQTVQAFLSHYAPANENDLPAYLLAVTTALRAERSDTLRSLSTAQRTILAETIMRQEGWYSKKRRHSAPVEGYRAP